MAKLQECAMWSKLLYRSSAKCNAFVDSDLGKTAEHDVKSLWTLQSYFALKLLWMSCHSHAVDYFSFRCESCSVDTHRGILLWLSLLKLCVGFISLHIYLYVHFNSKVISCLREIKTHFNLTPWISRQKQQNGSCEREIQIVNHIHFENRQLHSSLVSVEMSHVAKRPKGWQLKTRRRKERTKKERKFCVVMY